MPTAPLWYERLNEIEAAVRALPCPVVDRGTVERLFGVGRRRAIQLLGEFGGWQSGRTFLVDRDELAGRLSVLAESPGVKQERKRRRKLTEHLVALESAWKTRRVLIHPESGGLEGVKWGERRLVIEFGNEEQLLARLWAVAQLLSERSSVLL